MNLWRELNVLRFLGFPGDPIPGDGVGGQPSYWTAWILIRMEDLAHIICTPDSWVHHFVLIDSEDTVDGRNLAPPGMVLKLYEYWDIIYLLHQLVSRISSINSSNTQTFWIFWAPGFNTSTLKQNYWCSYIPKRSPCMVYLPNNFSLNYTNVGIIWYSKKNVHWLCIWDVYMYIYTCSMY